MVAYKFSSKKVITQVEDAKSGETAIYQSWRAKGTECLFPDQDESLTSVYKFFKKYALKYSDKRALGWRDCKNVFVETKIVTKYINGIQKVPKQWQYYEMGPYKFITYLELYNLVNDYGSGMHHIGLKPKDMMHIYAQTSQRWMFSALAAFSRAIVVVTAYDTLGEEGLTCSLKDTESVAMFVDKALLGSLLTSLKKGTSLRVIIHGGDITPMDIDEGDKNIVAIKELLPDIQIYSIDEVISLGKEHPYPVENSEFDDSAFIMYTSGSTGTPKGVVLCNKQLISSVAGVTKVIDRSIITPNDQLLNFLPLSHILEIAVEFSVFFWGACIGYGSIKTVSNLSMRNCKGDLCELQPTILIGVPAIWEPLRKGILGKVKDLPSFKQKIFWAVSSAKQKLDHLGLPGGDLLSNIFFKEIKKATGGRLRYVCSAGAPLSIETQKFITNLVCPILIGYGLTESSANGTFMHPQSFDYGTIGELLPTITAKLIDVPDINYFAKNNQGELCIKGPPIMKEYYKNPTETKKSFTEDGYFLTGDIVEWMPNGHLKIIDRRKNLVKTQNGEYIALEKLEARYRSSSYVTNLCVYADHLRVKPIALVIPNERPTQQLANELGLDESDWYGVCKHPKIIETIFNDMLEVGTKLGLRGIELLQNIALISDEWTSQNQYLTSAQKLNRKKIVDDNIDLIKECYGNY